MLCKYHTLENSDFYKKWKLKFFILNKFTLETFMELIYIGLFGIESQRLKNFFVLQHNTLHFDDILEYERVDFFDHVLTADHTDEFTQC